MIILLNKNTNIIKEIYVNDTRFNIFYINELKSLILMTSSLMIISFDLEFMKIIIFN